MLSVVMLSVMILSVIARQKGVLGFLNITFRWKARRYDNLHSDTQPNDTWQNHFTIKNAVILGWLS